MRVAVSDLVGRPGETRPLARELTREDLGGEPWGPADDTLSGPLRLDLHLDSVVEGILVRGTVEVDLELACARCLEPVEQHVDIDVVELFRPPGDEDTEPGYAIIDEAIELDTLLHDAIIVAVPLRVLCRENCAGLCPVCGTDRNEADCGHDQSSGGDPRWAPLRQLDLHARN